MASIQTTSNYGILTFEYNRTAFDVHNSISTIEWKLYYTETRSESRYGSITTTVTLNDVNQPKRNVGAAAIKDVPLLIDWGTIQLTHSPYDSSVTLKISTTTTGFIGIPDFYDEKVDIANGHRYANFTATPATMTDEVKDLTISFSVPSPSTTTALRLGIDFGGGYSYTTLSPNTTSFTYALTQSDYIALQEHTSVKNFKVPVILESTVDGRDYSQSKSITCNFVNAEPEFTVSIVDVNTAMSNLTDDAANKLVRGYSNAQVTVTSTPKKGAYIVSETVVCGNQSLTYGSGTLYGVESSEFVITVTDSRGYAITQRVTKTLVNYIPLTCNMEVDVPSSSGSTTVRLKGNCFYGSFGSKTNTLTVGYRYAESGSAYSNWKTSTISIVNNNTYSVNFSVTGLDYTKAYTFEARAIDLVETAYSVEIKVKSTPVFDWSENDFNFNVPVNFEKGFTVPNSAYKQLWNGQYHMNGTTTSINLIESVSSQTNGLVLIFTPYDSSTGLANDEKLMSFFVSKKVVQVMPSKLHTFLLIPDASFSTIGAKSVYISDTKITGYAASGNSGTSKGVTFNNAGFVLRYVLGV